MRTSKKRRLWKFLKIILVTLFTFILIGIIAGGALFAYYVKDTPELNEKDLTVTLATEIYDANDNLITTLGTEDREYVDFEDIPDLMRDAVLSVEDNRFYEHSGIDPIRLASAVVANVKNGFGSQGASTITQQVIKMSSLTSEKTLKRKAQEAYLAYKLEQTYSKNYIFEVYMNKIYYSDNQYGVKAAAKYYFDKPLDELTLPQAAMLAGIPQSPNKYNPYDYPEEAKKRRDTVLFTMLNNHKITEQQYQEATETKIDDGLVQRDKDNRQTLGIFNPKYSAYLDAMIKELNSYDAIKKLTNDPFNQGWKIYTNLNPEAQIYVQTALDDNYAGFKDESQAAMTVIDTKTGRIIALGGGRNYKFSELNYAYSTKQQPGSSIKPIVDYAPAIEYLQYNGSTIISDQPYRIAGTDIFIQNWDRINRYSVTMQTAVKSSFNVPAVRTFDTLGFDRASLFADKLGIHMTDPGVTSAIGGSTDNYSTTQMAAAYAAFGNDGQYNKPLTIRHILDAQGQQILNNEPENEQVMLPSTAFIMTSVLKHVMDADGTAPYAAIPGLNIAGKSGTTTMDDNVALNFGWDVNNAAKDSWFIGYSPNITIAVWQGFDQIDANYKVLWHPDTELTQKLFALTMKQLSDQLGNDDFTVPDDVYLKYGYYMTSNRNTETDDFTTGKSFEQVASENHSLLKPVIPEPKREEFIAPREETIKKEPLSTKKEETTTSIETTTVETTTTTKTDDGTTIIIENTTVPADATLSDKFNNYLNDKKNE